MGLEVALTAAMAAGSVAQGMAGASAANYQAQVAENNARIMEFNATRATQQAAQEAERTGLKGKEQLGQIAAIQGASGLEIGAGSTAQVTEGAQIVSRFDQLQDTFRGAVNATNFRNQGQNYLAEAQLRRMQGQNAMLSGIMGAGKSLLGGATSFAPKWAEMFSAQLSPFKFMEKAV